jgi:hypothetical protein
MKPTALITTVCATLIALGTAYWIHAREPTHRQPYPKATPPPPASNVFAESKEAAPGEQEIETLARERNAVLQAEIERALAGRDRQQLEAVFTFLLPELLQVDPARVVAMYRGTEPGQGRDQLRGEIARQWIGRDPHAAISWMESLEREDERRSAAREAMDVLVPTDLRLASAVAEKFRIGGGREPAAAR